MSNEGATLAARQREYLFAKLVQALGDDGFASRSGYIAQTAQRDYSQRLVESMCRGIEGATDSDKRAHVLLLGAATGTGKTLGYSVPAVAAACLGYKAGIATNTHHLQRQMLGTPDKPGDLRLACGWFAASHSGDIKIARRMGRQSFVSAAAVRSVADFLRLDESVSNEDAENVQTLLAWAESANRLDQSGLIEDVVVEFGGTLPAGISAHQIALGSDSPCEDFAAYEAHLVKADSADIVLVTHALLASSAMYRRGRIFEDGLDFLFVDEADQLADVAARTFHFGLSLDRFAKTCGLLSGQAGQDLAEAAHKLRIVATSLHEGSDALAFEQLSSSARARMDEQVDAVLRAFSPAAAAIRATNDTSLENELNDARTFIERLAKTAKDSLFASALSFSPTKKLPSLSLSPINPASLLKSVWSRKANDLDASERRLKAVLFTSATLATPGRGDTLTRFREAELALGIPARSSSELKVDKDLWADYEPERFGSVRFILADPVVPAPVLDFDEAFGTILHDGWAEYAASMIEAAHRSRGRTLVLARSYEDSRLFVEKLRQRGLGDRLIVQARGERLDGLAERFCNDPASIWISPSAWEGLNLPGMIQNLVVLRLPFRPPDPVSKALLMSRGQLTKKSVDSILQARAMSAAKRLLGQGFGRAIRKRDDRARIWIADGRFPLTAATSLNSKYPTLLSWTEKRLYPALHAVVAARFQIALNQASVLLQSGQILTP